MRRFSAAPPESVIRINKLVRKACTAFEKSNCRQDRKKWQQNITNGTPGDTPTTKLRAQPHSHFSLSLCFINFHAYSISYFHINRLLLSAPEASSLRKGFPSPPSLHLLTHRLSCRNCVFRVPPNVEKQESQKGKGRGLKCKCNLRGLRQTPERVLTWQQHSSSFLLELTIFI